MSPTYFGLLAEFGESEIPLERVCKKVLWPVGPQSEATHRSAAPAHTGVSRRITEIALAYQCRQPERMSLSLPAKSLRIACAANLSVVIHQVPDNLATSNAFGYRTFERNILAPNGPTAWMEFRQHSGYTKRLDLLAHFASAASVSAMSTTCTHSHKTKRALQLESTTQHGS